METIAGPVFRFSTRRAAAFSHGFDVARIGTGSPHRSDRRFIKHSDIRVRGFFGPVTARCRASPAPREPRGAPIEIQFSRRTRGRSGIPPEKQYASDLSPVIISRSTSEVCLEKKKKKKTTRQRGKTRDISDILLRPQLPPPSPSVPRAGSFFFFFSARLMHVGR